MEKNIHHICLELVGRHLAGMFLLLCGLLGCPVLAQAEEAQQEITLYGLDSSYLEKITIPASYAQEYQWNAGSGGDVSYKVVSGSSAKVSETGRITPQYTYWKKEQGYSMSVQDGEPYDYYTISAGDTTITAACGTETWQVIVHVKDYSLEYCNDVMDQYIEDYYAEGMSDRKLMEMIARFPA